MASFLGNLAQQLGQGSRLSQERIDNPVTTFDQDRKVPNFDMDRIKDAAFRTVMGDDPKKWTVPTDKEETDIVKLMKQMAQQWKQLRAPDRRTGR